MPQPPLSATTCTKSGGIPGTTFLSIPAVPPFHACPIRTLEQPTFPSRPSFPATTSLAPHPSSAPTLLWPARAPPPSPPPHHRACQPHKCDSTATKFPVCLPFAESPGHPPSLSQEKLPTQPPSRQWVQRRRLPASSGPLPQGSRTAPAAPAPAAPAAAGRRCQGRRCGRRRGRAWAAAGVAAAAAAVPGR